MIIDSIQNGIVIDHISAGKAMELYRILGEMGRIRSCMGYDRYADRSY